MGIAARRSFIPSPDSGRGLLFSENDDYDDDDGGDDTNEDDDVAAQPCPTAATADPAGSAATTHPRNRHATGHSYSDLYKPNVPGKRLEAPIPTNFSYFVKCDLAYLTFHKLL